MLDEFTSMPHRPLVSFAVWSCGTPSHITPDPMSV
jgi:hypothetical protein